MYRTQTTGVYNVLDAAFSYAARSEDDVDFEPVPFSECSNHGDEEISESLGVFPADSHHGAISLDGVEEEDYTPLSAFEPRKPIDDPPLPWNTGNLLFGGGAAPTQLPADKLLGNDPSGSQQPISLQDALKQHMISASQTMQMSTEDESSSEFEPPVTAFDAPVSAFDEVMNDVGHHHHHRHPHPGATLIDYSDHTATSHHSYGGSEGSSIMRSSLSVPAEIKSSAAQKAARRHHHVPPPPQQQLAVDEIITHPTDRDVLCYLGGGSWAKQNAFYRQLCNEHLEEYATTTKRGLVGKKGVVLKIVYSIMEQGGRFLKRNKDGTWALLTVAEAVNKVSQCMRDACCKRRKKERRASSMVEEATDASSSPFEEEDTTCSSDC